MILLLVSYGQAKRTHRSEIHIVNDTDTRVSFFITTEKYGRKQWTWKRDHDSYPSIEGLRLRVNGDDTIEIADWGKAYIDEVAEFEDGVWQQRAPSCPPRIAQKIATEKRFTRCGICPICIG